MKYAAALTILAAVASAAPAKRAQPAPVLRPRGQELIDGKYIVKLKHGSVVGAMSSAIASIAGEADHIFRSGLWHGFVSTLSDLDIEALRNDPNVDYIEQDAVVKMYTTQTGAPWGISRLSSKTPGSTTYTYDATAGAGTCAYIVDTGVEVAHKEFEGRAKWLANFADKDNTDGQGHGTHVAGTIGSKTYGVAKKTKIFAVKVLDSKGSGTNSGVIAGMDFVVDNAKNQTKDCPNGFVVNMSLGGATSTAVNGAAKDIIDAGIFLAVAAGNESDDAKTSSPASEKTVCTVGATTKTDGFATYSNFGSLVDILAPGTDILSTWIGGKTNTISGTSMATPHITGLGAYLLGLKSSSIPKDPQQLCAYMAKTAVSGAITGVPSGTVNKLANNGAKNGTSKLASRRSSSQPVALN